MKRWKSGLLFVSVLAGFGAAGACKSAPDFEVVAALDGGDATVDASDAAGDATAPDGGAEASADAETDGAVLDANADAGIVDAALDTGNDVGIDAGLPATPNVDTLLADPDCLLAFRGPVNDGISRPPVTTLQTDARCGHGVVFTRPGTAATWNGYTLPWVSMSADYAAPILGLQSLIPDGELALLNTSDLSLRATADINLTARPEWSAYFVVRAVPHGTNPGVLPLLDINGFNAAMTNQNFLFAVAFNSDVATTYTMANSRNNQWAGVQYGRNLRNDAVLVGIRYTVADGITFTLAGRDGPAHIAVSTTAIPSTAVNDVGTTYELPTMLSQQVRLLGSLSGSDNLQGAVSEFLLVGHAVDALTHARVVTELVSLHNL